jgi:multiple sugar transport system permease protein
MIEKKHNLKAWLYLIVPLIILSVFTIYPFINTIIISFDHSYNPTGSTIATQYGTSFGINAFRSILEFEVFQKVLRNTILIVVISVPVSTVLSLLIAVGLNSIKFLQKFFQFVFFTPYVTNIMALGMVFGVLFSQNNGIVNLLLGGNIDWIGINASPSNYLFVVIIYCIWYGLAFKILIFIGGLQNIGQQLYDSAKLDATPGHRVLTHITLPLLSPMVSYVVVTSLISSFKTYEAVIGVFSELESNSLGERGTIVSFIFEMMSKSKGFDPTDPLSSSYFSRGAAAAVILLVLILLTTLVFFKTSQKKVFYH